MLRGTVYGKFLADGPSVPLYTLTEEANPVPSGFPERFSKGHRHFSIRNGSERIGSFWLGSDFSFDYEGKRQVIGPQALFIYDVEVQPAHFQSMLAFLTNGLGSFQPDAYKLFLLVPNPLENPQAAGLYLIGGLSGNTFRLAIRPPSMFTASKDWLRHAFPTVSSVIYLAMSKRFSRFLLEGWISGEKMRASYAGPPQLAPFYAALLFDTPTASRLQHPLDVDFSITVGRNQGIASNEDALHIPIFIRALLDVSSTFEEYVEGLDHTAESDIKKICKAGYRTRISHDPLDLLLFYCSMYLPMLAVRHGQGSIAVSFNEMAYFFRNGFLLFVEKEGKPLGAAVAIRARPRLLLKFLGISQGDFAHTRAGVNSALLYFSIRHAFENGYKIFDLGYAGPFISDGLVWYKKKWKTRMVADRGIDILSMSFRNAEAKKLFLSRNQPFLIGETPEFDPPPCR